MKKTASNSSNIMIALALGFVGVVGILLWAFSRLTNVVEMHMISGEAGLMSLSGVTSQPTEALRMLDVQISAWQVALVAVVGIVIALLPAAAGGNRQPRRANYR